MKSLMRIILLFLVLLNVGCGYETVVSNLDQKQANEIVATLGASGITAKARSGRGRNANFEVLVSSGMYTTAVTVLHAANLPRDPQPTFRELTESKGIVPNSREIESARLDRALAVDIEEKLRILTGIADARVVLRTNLIKGEQLPSASVFIEELVGIEIDVNQIERAIQLAVPGIEPERVQILTSRGVSKTINLSTSGVESKKGVVIHRPLVPFLKFLSIPEDEYQRLAIVILTLFGVTAVVGGTFGYLLGRRREAARVASVRLPELRPQRTDEGSFASVTIEQRTAKRLGSDVGPFRNLTEG